MGYKYLRKPSPENAHRRWLTCTCNTQSEKAACRAEAEMIEGNFNLGLIIVQHGESPAKVQMSPNLWRVLPEVVTAISAFAHFSTSVFPSGAAKSV